MKRAIVFAEIPAPYRVRVFEELAKEYELSVYFNQHINQERHVDYMVRDSSLNYCVLDTPEALARFNRSLKNLKQYDFVLDYHFAVTNGVRLMLASIYHKVPCFINNDGAFIQKNFFKNTIKKFLIKRAALCFGSGESSRRYFRTFGAREENIRYHQFTSLTEADIMRKPLSIEAKQILKRQLKLEDKKTVITVGQFVYRKGFDVLLEAWKNVKGDYQLLMIGGGSMERSYLEFIKTNGLENVKLIEYLPKEELFKYYQAADLFVLPTRKDTWGLVINEAMACGLPIVSTDQCIGGVELIKNGINGFIVPVDNATALTEKISEIMQTDSLASMMSVNNLNKIQGYTMKNIAKTHIEHINEYFSQV